MSGVCLDISWTMFLEIFVWLIVTLVFVCFLRADPPDDWTGL